MDAAKQQHVRKLDFTTVKKHGGIIERNNMYGFEQTVELLQASHMRSLPIVVPLSVPCSCPLGLFILLQHFMERIERKVKSPQRQLTSNEALKDRNIEILV